MVLFQQISLHVILDFDNIIVNCDLITFCCSYSHNVAPKGKYIAFVSVEADIDQPEVELQLGIALLGPVDEMFFDTYDRFVPVNEPSLDNCFISTVRGSVIFLAMNAFTYIGFANVLGIELQLIISVIASEL